jgi:hypothetical protein
MNEAKQHLIQLIEAYASARSTNSQLLSQQSAGALMAFLNAAEVALPEQEDDGGQG